MKQQNKKQFVHLAHEQGEIMDKGYDQIPTFVFRDRSLSVLEVMTEYLKDVKKLSYHQIAVLLNRNDRTIWTVYRRAKLKRKGLIRRIAKEE